MSPNALIKQFIVKNPSVTSRVLGTVRKFGFDIIDGPNPEAALLFNYDINLILDVGANIGQYVRRTRTLGYSGKIISFEPIASVFDELQTRLQSEPLWSGYQLGLGNYDGTATINVSQHPVFSSLMPQTAFLQDQYDGSDYVNTEDIQIRKLDSIFNQHYQSGDRVFLKIDVQGYEKNVLEGAIASLNHILGLQLELSFFQHYEGEWLMYDMLEFLRQQGFTLVSLKPLSHNLQTNNLCQADGIFLKLS